MGDAEGQLLEPVWVRIGGGMELVPGGRRHGPADPALPPPGGLDQALRLDGRLVGWAERSDPALARRAALLGQSLGRERRSHLVGRLDHKLRSALLSLQESARAAAFGRPDQLEVVYDLAQEAGRRAAGLSAAAMDPKDSPRGVVLAMVLRLAAREAVQEVPADAIVWACEPVLVEALGRIHEWMGGPGTRFQLEALPGWVRMLVTPAPERAPLPVPELGEPLVRLLVDMHLGGWLDSQGPGPVSVYLPAMEP